MYFLANDIAIVELGALKKFYQKKLKLLPGTVTPFIDCPIKFYHYFHTNPFNYILDTTVMTVFAIANTEHPDGH